MHIPENKIERFFAQYEFSVPFQLSCSDSEPITLPELLDMTDHELRNMWDTLWLGYTESQGHPLLRQQIAGFHTKIKPDDVVVCAAMEGIFLSMNVLLNRNDHVIVTFPGYQALYEVARSVGCEVSMWTIHEEKGWQFDVAELAALIKPNTKLIVFNFPHNPTGALITRAQLDQIIDLARTRNLYLFSDEMYRYLEYNEQERLPSVSDLYERALSLSGTSKTIGMPGIRIGWLTTQDRDLLKRIMEFKDYTTICSSAPSELLALMGLRSHKTLVERSLSIIKKNITVCDQFFNKHGDRFSWHKPKAGSVAFARYLGKEGVTALSTQLMLKKGVTMLPSTVFDYGDHHFRIGTGRRNIPQIMEIIDQFLSGR